MISPYPTGIGDALKASSLAQFAGTTSAQMRNIITDETGTGKAVFGTSPTLITPELGAAKSASLPVFATDILAGLGGVAQNAFYQTATGELRIKL